MAGWLRWLRWLLVLPVAWLSWIVAAMVALTLYTIAETLCPREQMISGLCTAPWFDHAERAILSFGAGLAAALITVSCTLLAPSHRRVVVVVTPVIVRRRSNLVAGPRMMVLPEPAN